MARQTCIRCYGALFSKFIGLAAISSVVLLSACGEDSLPADDPLVQNDVPIVYIKRPVASLHNPRDPVGALPSIDPIIAPGGDLYTRPYPTADAPETNLTAAFTAAIPGDNGKGSGDVSDLDVSYDGKKVVFAMHTGMLINPTDPNEMTTWNIWVYDRTDGSIIRAISTEYEDIANYGNDIDPMFLPDGRVVFASDRKPRSYEILLEQDGQSNQGTDPTLLLDETRQNPIFNLHVLVIGENPNNSDSLKQITFNRSNDLNPTLLRDGRIAYTRWDNANGRDHLSLSTIRPDGTEYNLLYGAHSYTATERILYESRQVPDGRLLSVKMPRDGTFLGGKLVFLDQDNFVELGTLRAGGNSSSSSAEESASKSSVSENVGLSRGGRFTTPFPLWDGSNRALVSWAWCEVIGNNGREPCTDNNTGLQPAEPMYGLWMMDLNDLTINPIDRGTPDVAITDPVALIDRFSTGNAPTYLADKSLGAELDVQMDTAGVGLLKIRSVYDTDNPTILIANTGTNLTTIMNTPADQRLIRFVRITKPAPITDNGVNSTNMREIYGYQEVEPDGSVMVQVPAQQPFGIELLDKYGRRLSSDTSWLQVLPGETVQCNGCHTSRTSSTPLNAGAPNDTAAFTGTVLHADVANLARLLPQTGETMAETRARVGGCSATNMNCSYVRLKGDLVYKDDVWEDPDNLSTVNDALDINLAWADLDTPAPVDAGCPGYALPNPVWASSSGQYCWITIQYETHIHPLWEKERPQVDGMGQPIYNIAGDPTSGQLNYKCVLCHTEIEPADGVTPKIPDGQLTLTVSGLHTGNNNEYTSYMELRTGDSVQIINNGALEYQLVDVPVTDNNVDPPVTTIEAMRVPLVDGNQTITTNNGAVQNDNTSASDVPVRPQGNFIRVNANGTITRLNDGPFLTKMIKGHSNNGDTINFEFDGNSFGATVNHSGMLTDAELRLMIEWIDTGARYESDPFAP